MDPRNYSITNLDKPRRRLNPKSKSDDLNEIDVDFDIELKNDKDGSPRYVKVSKCMKDQSDLESETILRVNYGTDKDNKVGLDDLVCDSFANKNRFKFILSLNDFHKYKYEVKLKKGKTLTFRRMYKIICQSAEHVLEDTLEFVEGAGDRAAAKAERAELRAELKEQMAKANANSTQNGGFIRFIKSLLGGGAEFSVGEKLKVLEVEYVGVQESSGKIFVEFSGFEADVDPKDTL
jgi:hypothetical protein